MTNWTWIVGLTAAGLLHATGAAAQDAPADSALVAATTAKLRSDLRNFVVAQEAYFADHVTYAASQRDLQGLFRPSRGVTLVLLTASDRWHSEIAIDEGVPGLVCAMYVGSAPKPLGRGDEGEVVCRGP